jgi:hypothetical protein
MYAKTYAKMAREGCILAMPSVINTVDNLADIIYVDIKVIVDTVVEDDAKEAQPQGEPARTIVEQKTPTQLEVELDDPQEDYSVQEGTFDSAQQEWLYWHYKLGHLPKGRMTQSAKEGGTPKKLAKITISFCEACIHGKQTKTPWRTKEEPKIAPKVASYTGECVAVDQLLLHFIPLLLLA